MGISVPTATLGPGWVSHLWVGLDVQHHGQGRHEEVPEKMEQEQAVVEAEEFILGPAENSENGCLIQEGKPKHG